MTIAAYSPWLIEEIITACETKLPALSFSDPAGATDGADGNSAEKPDAVIQRLAERWHESKMTAAATDAHARTTEIPDMPDVSIKEPFRSVNAAAASILYIHENGLKRGAMA